MFLDKGGAGKVFAVEDTGFCIKVVQDRASSRDGIPYDRGNSAAEEARLQMKVQKINAKGARAPVCVRVLQGDVYSAIVMEQLEAANLQKILAGEECLPASFDHNAFFGALEEYVDEIHIACNVSHGDLKARNIMVDRESGLPYIIDFGRAQALNDDAEQRRACEHQDWNDCEKVEQQVQTYLERLEK